MLVFSIRTANLLYLVENGNIGGVAEEFIFFSAASSDQTAEDLKLFGGRFSSELWSAIDSAMDSGENPTIQDIFDSTIASVERKSKQTPQYAFYPQGIGSQKFFRKIRKTNIEPTTTENTTTVTAYNDPPPIAPSKKVNCGLYQGDNSEPLYVMFCARSEADACERCKKAGGKHDSCKEVFSSWRNKDPITKVVAFPPEKECPNFLK